jgi:hypothetical protein
MLKIPIRKSRQKIVAALLVVIAIVILLAVGIEPQQDSGHLGLKVSGDFLPYWASVRLLLSGQNPYDTQALSAIILHTAGPGGAFMRVYTPPALAGLLIPFGLLPFNIALLAWTIASVALFLVGLHLVYQTIQPPHDHRTLVIKFAFILSFYPTFLAIKLGQIIPLLFCCIAFFFANQAKLDDRRKGFLSGVALAVCTVKPHLFLPFLVGVFLWTLRAGMWRLARGFFVGVAFLWSFPVCFNPRVYGLYLNSDLSNSLNWRTPSVGFWLAELCGGWAYLMFVPLLLGCGYALLTGLVAPMDQGAPRFEVPCLMPLSLACAPYLWMYDFVLLIPAIVLMLHRGENLSRFIIFGSNTALWLGPREMEYSFWYPVLMTALALSVCRERSASPP